MPDSNITAGKGLMLIESVGAFVLSGNVSLLGVSVFKLQPTISWNGECHPWTPHAQFAQSPGPHACLPNLRASPIYMLKR